MNPKHCLSESPSGSIVSSNTKVSETGIVAPAPLDLPQNIFMNNQYFVLPNGMVFIDKKIPKKYDQLCLFTPNMNFSTDYFVDLHSKVAEFGVFNYLGARIKLVHCQINVNKFRELLPDSFEDLALMQYLEYGFPLGLQEDFVLLPVLKNHSSSYNYFSHLDKFIAAELDHHGITGPFCSSPFDQIMTSPLMTSIKKPDGRRSVFDASFGDHSLNVNTPEKYYLSDDYEFSFPRVDDFANLILKLGKGCFMWKRDLSRFFLQLPLDPFEYNKTAFIWRGSLFFFTSFVWGCRHAGLNGQRVSSAVSAIHRSLGKQSYCSHLKAGCLPDCSHYTPLGNAVLNDPFNTLNYSDDFGGAEVQHSRSKLSFDILGSLLYELGIAESLPKAVSPCNVMKYLGIVFDSLRMEMRIDTEKCIELLHELKNWIRRTVATKSELQSILGKLMWVARAVKYSRCFILRIISEMKSLSYQNQKIKLSDNVKKDFLWWYEYMTVFNGVELLIPDIVQVHLAGDACPAGLGSWNREKEEYFSRKFPFKLLDPQIPIHIKEFICVILSLKLWGSDWMGKKVEIFCDNDSVCDVITNLKAKDSEMQKMLREFLYWVCRYNCSIRVSKIGTKENLVADFISRNFCTTDAKKFFCAQSLPSMKYIEISDEFFSLQANW